MARASLTTPKTYRGALVINSLWVLVSRLLQVIYLKINHIWSRKRRNADFIKTFCTAYFSMYNGLTEQTILQHPGDYHDPTDIRLHHPFRHLSPGVCAGHYRTAKLLEDSRAPRSLSVRSCGRLPGLVLVACQGQR